MYQQNHNLGNVTPIEDILDDETAKKIQGKIRHTVKQLPNFGAPQQFIQRSQHPHIEKFEDKQMMFEPPQFNPLFMNCRDVAEHVTACPVCSKLYTCDKTIYIVIIILLVIACIILTKKLLESMKIL